MDRPRIGILGSGAVGGLYGGILANGGYDVHFLLNSDFHHVKEHGLRIDSVLGNFHLDSPNVYSNVGEFPRCDFVIIALKSIHNSRLDDWLPTMLSDDGIILTLQNGLGVEADCRLAAPGHAVLGGCCFLCSNKVGPGHIHHLDYGRIVFGADDAHNEPHAVEAGKQLCLLMNNAGIDAQWTDDLPAARWRKLMWNIPFNGLSVVLDASTDEILGCPATKQLANTIIAEVHRAATELGIKIDPQAIETTMSHTETMVPYDSSMRLDYRHGRPMEIEAILGAPLRAVAELTLANQTDVRMPHVQMLHQQLQFLDSRRASEKHEKS